VAGVQQRAEDRDAEAAGEVVVAFGGAVAAFAIAVIATRTLGAGIPDRFGPRATLAVAAPTAAREPRPGRSSRGSTRASDSAVPPPGFWRILADPRVRSSGPPRPLPRPASLPVFQPSVRTPGRW
jgi:hypothetical protein